MSEYLDENGNFKKFSLYKETLPTITSDGTDPIPMKEISQEEKERIKEQSEYTFNALELNRSIKWEGLSDGGKWTRAIEAMELQATAERILANEENQWVKASDRKPEECVSVLVFIPEEDGHCTTGMWDVSKKWVLLDDYRVPQSEVTYWRPMVNLPTDLSFTKHTEVEVIPDTIARLQKEIFDRDEEIEKLKAERTNLKTVMIAAAEEIQAHWQAHCDEEGYGPTNLMHRLEKGLASNYSGYSAGAFLNLTEFNKELQSQKEEVFSKMEQLQSALREVTTLLKASLMVLVEDSKTPAHAIVGIKQAIENAEKLITPNKPAIDMDKFSDLEKEHG